MTVLELINKEALDELRIQYTRFTMAYKFALEEISTKVNILKEEFRLLHDYNPIEHVSTRVKSTESLIKKIQRKNLPFSIGIIQEKNQAVPVKKGRINVRLTRTIPPSRPNSS